MEFHVEINIRNKEPLVFNTTDNFAIFSVTTGERCDIVVIPFNEVGMGKHMSVTHEPPTDAIDASTLQLGKFSSSYSIALTHFNLILLKSF